MSNKLMTGVWRYIIGAPPFLWEKQIAKAEARVRRSTSFMTPEHRRVHHFAVSELPRMGRPMPAALVADRLAMAAGRVLAILDELEKRLTFLWRNPGGEILWAYPVTVEKTPHAITFHTGEQLYAA